MENTSRTIYGLTSVKDDYKIRYVGTTTVQPAKRLAKHLGKAKNGSDWLVCRWIRARLRDGFEIIMVCLEQNAPNREVEEEWIRIYRQKNKNLMNSEIGGNAKLPGYKLSEDHKKNISLGIKNSTVWKPRSGHQLDDDHKAKISAGLLASNRDYTEQGKKISKALTGRKLSDEHVAALKAAKRPGWTEERRAKVALTNASAETKEKRSQAAKNRSATPEQREILAERGLRGAKAKWDKTSILE